MERPDWLTKSFDATRRLSDLSYEMREVARALAISGNRDLAQRVGLWAEDVAECGKDASAAMSENINDSLRTSERATGNMLMALMAGASITGSPEQRAAISGMAERMAQDGNSPDKVQSND